MREATTRVIRIPVAGPRGEIEVHMVTYPPARWRVRLALWLIRMAGRCAKFRVRVTGLGDRVQAW
jgi:hypothetical protein